jgi:hypothetical protein
VVADHQSSSHYPPQDIAAVADHTDHPLYPSFKRLLWLPTTDHLRKSADYPTCTNIDSDKFARQLPPSGKTKHNVHTQRPKS